MVVLGEVAASVTILNAVVQQCYKVYGLLEESKNNKEECVVLRNAVRNVEAYLKLIDPRRLSEAAHRTLDEISEHMQAAHGTVSKLTTWGPLRRLLLATQVKDELSMVTRRVESCMGRLNAELVIKMQETEAALNELKAIVVSGLADTRETVLRQQSQQLMAIQEIGERACSKQVGIEEARRQLAAHIMAAEEVRGAGTEALWRELEELQRELLAAGKSKGGAAEKLEAYLVEQVECLLVMEAAGAGPGPSAAPSPGVPRAAKAAVPPDALCCPITGEIMSDPVLLVETGHTYERAAIERWFTTYGAGRRCPVTNLELTAWPPQLVPNYAIKKQVAAWREESGDTAQPPPQPAAKRAERAPAAKAGPGPGSQAEPSAPPLCAATAWPEWPPTSAAACAGAGAARPYERPPAVTLAACTATCWKAPEAAGPAVSEEPCAPILKGWCDTPFKAATPGAKGECSGKGAMAVEEWVELLGCGSAEVQGRAAAALRDLSNDSSGRLLVADAGAVAPLVALLSCADATAREQAAGALRNLAGHPKGRAAVVRSGGAAALVALLSNGTGGDVAQEHAAATLWALCGDPAGREEVISAGGIPALVGLLGSESVAVRERAVGAIWSLADDEAARAAITASGGMQQLTRLAADSGGGGGSGGSGGASVRNRAAGALMKFGVNLRGPVSISRFGAVP